MKYPRLTPIAIVLAFIFLPQCYRALATMPLQPQIRYLVRGDVVDANDRAVPMVNVYLVQKGKFSLDGGTSVVYFTAGRSDDQVNTLTDSRGMFSLWHTEFLDSRTNSIDSIAVMTESNHFGPFFSRIDTPVIVTTFSYLYATNNDDYVCNCSPTTYSTVSIPELMWYPYVVKDTGR